MASRSICQPKSSPRLVSWSSRNRNVSTLRLGPTIEMIAPSAVVIVNSVTMSFAPPGDSPPPLTMRL